MVFVVNGTDIMPLALADGVSWKRVNIEGSNSMTMQDGTDVLDRIAVRYNWTFKFKSMTAAEQAALLTLLDPRSVSVRFTDPQTLAEETVDYYVSDIPAGYLTKRTNGTEYWGGLTASFSSKPGVATV